ncbi:two-pore potassium channel 3-like [Populus alba x Populus x berolinensis]|nr:two-pore potassium channel 3-like [Populus alba x Populus x berolinensis]
MEKEPLLPYLSPRKRTPQPQPQPPLFPLPEDDEISLPLPLTTSELKDRLIFGPSSASPRDPSPLLEALTLSLNSPRSSTPNLDFSSFLDSPHLQHHHHQQQPPSWLVDPDCQWTKTNLHRSKTAPAMAYAKLLFSWYCICLLVCLYILLNRDKFKGNATNPVVDALYFCIVTMCTIGYGDITPDSTATKLFSIFFVLIGFGFVDILLSGMVSYVLDLQESHLLRNVKRGVQRESAGSYIIDVKKGRMRIRMKVGLALGVVVLCIGVGVAFMHFVERLGWLDSLYLSVMSVTTVGYGDRAFTSLAGRIFASIWLLVSTLAVARAFLYLAEARVDKRHRKLAKWVLGQNMTVSEFLAADIDNNGFVSKSEYAIYKLKEMEKVSEKDILQICEQFDRLDTGNCGKITLADLMESQP